MTVVHPNYRSCLKAELESRCRHNPRYSLRAFARDLSLSSSRLSEILNGKVGISRTRAEYLAQRLGLNNEERSRFCDLVESEDARSKLKREIAKARLLKDEALEYQQLQMDAFKVIADWQHYAILELCLVKNFKNDPCWIARSLEIPEMEAKLAIERLKRLELLEVREGKLCATSTFTASSDGVPSESIKRFHQQILMKANQAIFTQTVEERNLSSMVMAFDSRELPRVTDQIKSFRRKFNQEFGKSHVLDSVYCLAIQFFRIAQPQGEKR